MILTGGEATLRRACEAGRHAGLPPRALPALLAPPVLLFALITWQVLADGPLVGVDERASGALVHPDRLSEVLSDLGNVPVAVPVLALALVYVAWHGRATARTAGGCRRWPGPRRWPWCRRWSPR